MELFESNLHMSKAQVLKNEILRQEALRGNYSLRALAKDLGVSHTLVSLVFNGKRELSDALIRKALETFNFPKNERDVLLVGLKPEKKSHPEPEKISIELFEKISKWVHYAILSLTEVEGFQWSEEWISSRINIPPMKAAKAMADLLKAKLIVQDENGNYRQSQSGVIVDNKTPTEATKKFNRGLLEKALESMEQDEYSLRDLSSVVMAIDPKFIPYAIERIRSFRISLCNELENLGNKKEAYALAVQIFPLTKNGVSDE